MIYRLSSFQELLAQRSKSGVRGVKIALETMKLKHLREIGFVCHILLSLPPTPNPAQPTACRPTLTPARLSLK
jgi:hypothetical protein